MSKSIYEEAIKVVTYLQEKKSHLKNNYGAIYISTEKITTLENLLIHSHKQEKLLGLYRELATVRDDMLSYCDVEADEFFDIQNTEIELVNQIKELEK